MKMKVTRKWGIKKEGNYVLFRDSNREILKLKADQGRKGK